MARHVFHNDIEEGFPGLLGPMNDAQLLNWLRTKRSRWLELVPKKHQEKVAEGFGLEMEKLLS